ncbi:MAG: MFS transporter [Pseudomonadota bacterium]
MTSIVAAGSYTTLAGLLTTEFVEKIGWGVDMIGPGIAINMLFYGLTAPFSIYVMRRYEIAKVANTALFLLILGSCLILFPMPLLFNFVWGFVIGIGTGCLTMAYGSLIVKTWFPNRQGVIAGYLVASSVFGQFALLPFWSEVMQMFGWRAPLIGSALIAACAIGINAMFLREPKDEDVSKTIPMTAASERARFYQAVLKSLFGAMKTRIFWTLGVLFIICGATTNGIMWSHFTLAATICGLTVTAASSVLLLIGIFNVFGTTVSGWLTDRISVRTILATIFLVRALTLLWLPSILVGVFDTRIVAFGIIFGIMDVATVPPVIAICNRIYGDDGPSIFGWVNAFHQLGAGLMALSGSMIWLAFGSYDVLWYTSGVLCLLACIIVFTNSYRPRFHTLVQG